MLVYFILNLGTSNTVISPKAELRKGKKTKKRWLSQMRNALRVLHQRILIKMNIMAQSICTADTLDGKCLLSFTIIPKCYTETYTTLILIIANLSYLHLSFIDTISFLTMDKKTIKRQLLNQKRAALQVRTQAQKLFKKR